MVADTRIVELVERCGRQVKAAAADQGLDEDVVAHDVIMSFSELECTPEEGREVRRVMLGWTESDEDFNRAADSGEDLWAYLDRCAEER